VKETEAEKDKDKEKADASKPKSINDIINESDNAEILALKDKIESIRKEKSNLFYQLKSAKRKLNYKIAEEAALSNFLNDENNQIDIKKLIGLKKLKNRLEFKLSTEARISLYEEKDIIRKINIISNQLNEMYKFQRLKKKGELVTGDIESLKENITKLNSSIGEKDKELDEAYDNVRRILGFNRKRDNRTRDSEQRRRPVRTMQPQEINLEDIVVIKKK